jgi:hypothetical protein
VQNEWINGDKRRKEKGCSGGGRRKDVVAEEG